MDCAEFHEGLVNASETKPCSIKKPERHVGVLSTGPPPSPCQFASYNSSVGFLSKPSIRCALASTWKITNQTTVSPTKKKLETCEQ